jgi:hypothetical protein
MSDEEENFVDGEDEDVEEDDDIDEEEEEEEFEEEEEEEEEPRGAPARKRRKFTASSFVDDEAEVDEDADEEEEDEVEGEEYGPSVDAEEEVLAVRDARRLQQRYDLASDEQLAKHAEYYEQRYGNYEEDFEGEEDEEFEEGEEIGVDTRSALARRTVLPTVKDPKLWRIKCKVRLRLFLNKELCSQ